MTINNKTILQFDENFFKEEVRCEYKVTSKTKRIWAVEIDLLDQLLKVCKKHNIKIFVFAGTLLGAIRHKGFIPWDDDIDVCMTRSEFEKLVAVADKEFSYPYFFQTALSDRKYFFGYARLRNSLTTGHVVKQSSPNYNHGIYIDIFVLDGYEPGKKLARQLRQRKYVTHLLHSYYSKEKSWLQFILHYTICKLIPYEKGLSLYNTILSKYNKKSDKLTFLTHPLYLLERYWCYKKDLNDVTYMQFENIEVPVPSNYDSVLTNIFGNYMEFPPVEKRGEWHSGKLYLDPDMSYKDYFKSK